MRVTVNQFLSVLAQADVVSVDNGPYLHSWEVCDVTHVPENEVVRFTWTDGDYTYEYKLTEGEILLGKFTEPNKFVCSEIEENDTSIRFFNISPLTPSL